MQKYYMHYLVNGVKAGRISELKSVVESAKRDPKNPMYRVMLQELNFIYNSEDAIPSQYKEEVKTLLVQLAKIIKRSK